MSIPAMDWEPNSGNVLSHRTPGAAVDANLDPAWPGDQAAPPLFLERFKRELRLGGVTWQQFCALSFDSIAEFDAAVRSTVRDATDIQIRMMRAEFVGSGGDLGAHGIRSGQPNQRFPSPPAPAAWTPSSAAAHEQTPLLSTKTVGLPTPSIAAPYAAAPYIAPPSISAPYIPIAPPHIPTSFIPAPGFARGAWVVSTLFVIVAWQIRPYSWLWEQHDTAAWPHLIAMELVSALPVLLLMPVGAGLVPPQPMVVLAWIVCFFGLVYGIVVTVLYGYWTAIIFQGLSEVILFIASMTSLKEISRHHQRRQTTGPKDIEAPQPSAPQPPQPDASWGPMQTRFYNPPPGYNSQYNPIGNAAPVHDRSSGVGGSVSTAETFNNAHGYSKAARENVEEANQLKDGFASLVE
eukprot:TRINITY_DN3098_c0_g3_i1.p1 TRINITY_DN3098_c0_g3~~TRINITY_DN3098_c0_g3_i1.p1  ORF type:complete len:406 (+),score=71.29 TRINITY_DN3098_c0_g3_i1:2-1219(+)